MLYPATMELPTIITRRAMMIVGLTRGGSLLAAFLIGVDFPTNPSNFCVISLLGSFFDLVPLLICPLFIISLIR